MSSSVTHQCRGLNFAPGFFIWRCLVWGLVCFFVLSSFQPQASVRSQAEETLIMQAPDTSAFPKISVQIELPDSIELSGDDLLISQLQVLENGLEVPIQSLQKKRSGVYFTLAINGGRELDLRDSNGSSHFDKLREGLKTWASGFAFSTDAGWSLVTHEGIYAANNSSLDDWLAALMAYAPDFRGMAPSIESLSTAIQIAEARVVPFGVDKAVLYITPPPTSEQISDIQALAEQAGSAEIQVSVWMVGDPMFLHNDQGRALISLAEGTGGTFYHFSGTETLPDLTDFLSRLGFIYTLRYESLIRQTGDFPLQISANLRGKTFQADPIPFYVDVRPPKPVLVDPPTSIYRVAADQGQITSGALVGESLKAALYPDRQFVKYMVNFPDGYPRQIVASRLVVNGVVVAVKDSPPFDVITWNLSEILHAGEQIIQIEISDSLGLTGLSNEYPVQVNVDLPEAAAKPSTLECSLLIGGIITGLAVLTLLAWWVVQLIRTANLTKLKGILAKRSRKGWDAQGTLPTNPGPIYATLIPTGILGRDWEDHSIRITKPDGVFGKQPKQVDYLLQAAGVGGVHARLTLDENGFWLQDLDSVLGTWVNYRRIGAEPVKIQRGDLVHFGNCGFRFTMVNKSLPDNVLFVPYEPIL